MRIVLEEVPSPEHVAAIRHHLIDYNLSQVPAITELTHQELAVLWRDEADNILGGILAEIDWNWLYIDTVWVSDAARGKGVGSALMRAVESYAAEQGIRCAYLLTSSFQARPFYEKLGYTLIGQTDDRPINHSTYYLKKDTLVVQPDDPHITRYIPPTTDQIRFLNQALIEHSYQHVPIIFAPLCVWLKGDAGEILGGMYGNIYWDWLDLRYFALAASVRGQGYGAQILATAEAHLRQRGIRGMVTDTADFQSLSFYKAQGFTIFGELAERPPAHRSYFIQKTLS